jgi:phosphopantetheinyl transferase (holo-ACP synthase)
MKVNKHKCGGCGELGHKLPSCRHVPGHEGKSRCATCKEWLSVDEFSIRNKKTGVLQRLCKECMRPYRRKWYRKHHEEQVARTLANRLAKKEAIRDMKSNPCTDCGQTFHWAVMDFDHLDGKEKESSVSVMVQNGVSMDRILAEISKCELVCSNCHRLRTWNRLDETERERIRNTVLAGHARARERGVVVGGSRKVFTRRDP